MGQFSAWRFCDAKEPENLARQALAGYIKKGKT